MWRELHHSFCEDNFTVIVSSATDIAETPVLLGHIQHEFAAKCVRLQLLESRETILETCATVNNRMWAPLSPNHITGPVTRETATDDVLVGDLS